MEIPDGEPKRPSFRWDHREDEEVVAMLFQGYQWLCIGVPGALSGKSRGRVGMVGKGDKRRATVFKSRKEREDERGLAVYIEMAMDRYGWEFVPLDGPYEPRQSVFVKLTRWHALPTSMSLRKKRQLWGRRVNRTPDHDNLIKQFMDAGNHLLWQDDRQVEIRGVITRLADRDFTRVECITPWTKALGEKRSQKGRTLHD